MIKTSRPLHAALVAYVRGLGYKVRDNVGPLLWYPEQRLLEGDVRAYPGDDGGNALLHEICHWLVATEVERKKQNLGLDSGVRSVLREAEAYLLECWIRKKSGHHAQDPEDCEVQVQNYKFARKHKEVRRPVKMKRLFRRIDEGEIRKVVQIVRVKRPR